MLLMVSVLGVVVIADQLAKAAIAARLPEGAFTSGSIGGVRFRHVINRRNPWGSVRAVRILIVLWLVLAAAALIAASLVGTPSVHIALGALIGGATGNLLDGISRNGVTDFVDLRVWPVFNLADAAIVAGVVLLLWNAIRFPAGA